VVTGPSDPRGPAARDHRATRAGAWQVLAVVFLATTLLAGSSMMLSIALPAIAADFHASAGATAWAYLAYQLTSVGFTVLMGQLSDSVDRRRLFLGGLVAFTVSTGLLAVAPTLPLLIALRALQGLAGAVLMATCAAVLAAVYPPQRLGGAMGVYLAGFSIAQAAGPCLGGVITSWAGWRWMFVLMLPLCLLALVWGSRALRLAAGAGSGQGVDVVGNTLLLASITLLLVGLSLASDLGWTSPVVVGSVVAGAVLAPALLRTARSRSARGIPPALDPALLRDRSFRLAMSAGMLVAAPRLALVVVVGLYYQGLHGLSPVAAALHVTAIAGGLTIGSVGADPFARRLGERRVGLALALVSLLALVVLLATVDTGGPLFVSCLLVLGTTTGGFQTLNVALLMRTAAPGRAGSLNGVRVMLQNVSLTLVVAVAISLVVSWVPADAARRFIAGDAAGLTAYDAGGIVRGFQALLVLLGVLVVAGAVAAWRTPEPRPVSRHEEVAAAASAS